MTIERARSDASSALTVLRRGVGLVAVATLMGGAVGYFVSQQAASGYESSVRLLVGPVEGEESVVNASSALTATFGELVSDGPVLVNTARQLGLAVSNVETASEELESVGIGPFFIASGPVHWWEGGRELTFHGKLGLAFYHDIELELLEPGQGSDFYKNSLAPDGQIVIQHVGFEVIDVGKWVGELTGKGFSEMARGKFKAGPISVEFAYLDTLDQAGFITEFMTPWRFGSLNFSLPRPLVHLAGAFQKATGIRSF